MQGEERYANRIFLEVERNLCAGRLGGHLFRLLPTDDRHDRGLGGWHLRRPLLQLVLIGAEVLDWEVLLLRAEDKVV